MFLPNHSFVFFHPKNRGLLFGKTHYTVYKTALYIYVHICIYIYTHIFNTYIYSNIFVYIYIHTDLNTISYLSTHTFFISTPHFILPSDPPCPQPGLVNSVDTLDENYGILSKLWSLRDGRAGDGFSTNVTFSVSVSVFPMAKKNLYVLGGCQNLYSNKWVNIYSFL